MTIHFQFVRAAEVRQANFHNGYQESAQLFGFAHTTFHIVFTNARYTGDHTALLWISCVIKSVVVNRP